MRNVISTNDAREHTCRHASTTAACVAVSGVASSSTGGGGASPLARLSATAPSAGGSGSGVLRSGSIASSSKSSTAIRAVIDLPGDDSRVRIGSLNTRRRNGHAVRGVGGLPLVATPAPPPLAAAPVALAMAAGVISRSVAGTM